MDEQFATNFKANCQLSQLTTKLTVFYKSCVKQTLNMRRVQIHLSNSSFNLSIKRYGKLGKCRGLLSARGPDNRNFGRIYCEHYGCDIVNRGSASLNLVKCMKCIE